MTASIPRLYRYRVLNAYSLAELVAGMQWFAKPTEFNDPFDCALTIDARRFEESIAHAIEVGIRNGRIPANLSPEKRRPTESDRHQFEKLCDGIRGMASQLGVCYYTEDPTTILMWPHYA